MSKMSKVKVDRPGWNVGKVLEMLKDGSIDYDVPIQRKFVWSHFTKSRLIESLALGYPVSDIYLNEVDGKYEVIDGKQRLSSILEYIDEKSFALHRGIKEDDMKRKRFEQLSESTKTTILGYGLEIYGFRNLTIEQKKDIFRRANSGKPATPSELARIDILSRDAFISFSEHPAISNNLSRTLQIKGVDEDIVENAYILAYCDEPSLVSSFRSRYLKETKVTKEQNSEMLQALNYVNFLYNSTKSNEQLFRKMKNRSHIISMIVMAVMAIREGVDISTYMEKASRFFIEDGLKVTISDAYNASVQVGSIKPENLRVRINELEKQLLS